MTKKDMDLNLLLIYINSWEEVSTVVPGLKIIRAWKNYPFEITNELERLNLIRQYPRSLTITNEGVSKALALKHHYLSGK